MKVVLLEILSLFDVDITLITMIIMVHNSPFCSQTVSLGRECGKGVKHMEAVV